MSSRPKTDKFCRICDGPNAITHYGVISCRACGAFFRRAITSNRSYHCSCTKFDENDRLLKCKLCRFLKCLEVGMEKELVRAVQLQAFHRERKRNYGKNVKKSVNLDSEDCFDDENIAEDGNGNNQNSLCPASSSSAIDSQNLLIISLNNQNECNANILMKLLYIESNVRRIRHSSTPLDLNYTEQFRNLGELLKGQNNLLTKFESFSTEPPPNWNKKAHLERVERQGIWVGADHIENTESSGLNQLYKDLCLCIDIARIIPAFQRLNLHDKISLLNAGVHSATHFILFYYSLDRNTNTVVLPNGEYTIEVCNAASKYYRSNIIKELAYRSFTFPMEKFAKITPSKEEFFLLLILTLLNSAISDCLSSNAVDILNAECDNYARLLMQFIQSRFGAEAGALRYMECLDLISICIRAARNSHKMVIYIDAVHQQGGIEAIQPKAFRFNGYNYNSNDDI